MTMSIFITPRLCKDCGTCESVCDKHAVDVFTFEDDTSSISVPIMCMHCEEAACIDVCPVKAIYRDANATILVDKTKCIGCKLCSNACAFGNIAYNHTLKKILKCDLCDGSPDCVKYCPTGAIVFESATEANMNKKRVIAEKFKGLMELV